MGRVLFGIVTDNVDPEKLGRVQVKLLDWAPEVILPWIRVVQPFAGNAMGAFCLPDLDEQVVVLEGSGGIPGMVVLGSVYSGKRLPPKLNAKAEGAAELRGLVTKGGTEISVDDTSGSEFVTIKTKDGVVALLMDAAGKKLTLTGETEVLVDSKTKVVVKAKDVEVTGESSIKVDAGSGKVTVSAGTVEVTGTSEVKVSAPAIKLG